MKLSLLVSVGNATGKAIPITIPQFVIGRDPQCHLRPASAIISKRHCAVIVREGKAYLKDFGSTNGTLINDQRVEDEVELRNEDSLRIGPLAFKVQIEATTPVDKPTPLPKSKGDDDDIAAMLLSMTDDSDKAKPAALQDVPEGSTVLDIPAMNLNDTQQQTVPGQAGKKTEKAVPSGDTASAAEAILAKYSRRRRGSG